MRKFVPTALITINTYLIIKPHRPSKPVDTKYLQMWQRMISCRTETNF